MSRWLVKGPAIALVTMSVVAGGRWWNDWTHQVSYYDYLDKYVVAAGPRGPDAKAEARQWLSSHHDVYLAEGRAACEWLKEYPEVPEVVPDGSADSSLLAKRYVQQTADSTQFSGSAHTRAQVDRAAWAMLCPSVGESRTALAFNPDEDATGGD